MCSWQPTHYSCKVLKYNYSSEDDADQDESVVHVGDAILTSLRQEVASALATLTDRSWSGTAAAFPCPLCPFRSFDRKLRLIAHVRTFHDALHQYCCSGTKQLKIVAALYDSDQMKCVSSVSFLTRSAVILRKTVQPSLDPSCNFVDKLIGLVLTSSGPEYRSVHRLASLPSSMQAFDCLKQ